MGIKGGTAEIAGDLRQAGCTADQVLGVGALGLRLWVIGGVAIAAGIDLALSFVRSADDLALLSAALWAYGVILYKRLAGVRRDSKETAEVSSNGRSDGSLEHEATRALRLARTLPAPRRLRFPQPLRPAQ